MNNNKWTTNLIRTTWLDFFKNHDHLVVESQSLIPKNDNSLLWINSGVATLKRFFSGQENPPYKNLTNSQKCIRTNDIYNVGVTSRHQTFFEMLGNFSIGGYFKEHAIDLAFDLLINYFKLDINKLYITVYENDDIAYNCWINHNINKSHIIKCNKDRNFWDVGSGPCGPCTEIYYDRGEKYDPNKLGEKLFFEDIENDRYVEIWNIVFSEFNNINNDYVPLARKNIDTGAGIERLASILQDVPTNFDTDTFQIIIKSISKHTPNDMKYDINAYFSNNNKQLEINKMYKIIADHIRAVVFALSDGAGVSNKDRGYILRRLLRRIIINLYKLKIEKNIFEDLIDSVIEGMSEYYPYLITQKERVLKIINNEYEQFKKTLRKGYELFDKYKTNNNLDKHAIFKLVETYGLPIELIESFAEELDIKIDLDGYNELFKKHQLVSNANKSNKAMFNQNGELINLTVSSIFSYDLYNTKANVVALFDENFNKVDQLDANGYVVFDKTCFYATSGGQLNDCGYINDTIYVDDVFKGPNLQHIHHIINHDNQVLKLNQECNLEIDVLRRQKLAKNHSVEHLIHSSLVKFLDNNIKQEGAFKSPEKVTFDFQLDYKPSNDQLKTIENHINKIIKDGIKVDVLNLELDEAKKVGAMAYFEDVYKKIKGKLRVIKMENESIELCGGTHVNNTSDIEQFKILSCSPKGAGSWRIEAITSNDTINDYYLKLYDNIISSTKKIKKEADEMLIDNKSLNKLFNEILNTFEYSNDLEFSFNELTSLFNELKFNLIKQKNKNEQQDIKNTFINAINDNQHNKNIICVFNNKDNKLVFNSINELINEYNDKVFVGLNIVDNKLQYLLATNLKNANENKINLNDKIKLINQLNNGKGGGKNNYVQGGFNIDNLSIQELNNIVDKIKNIIN